MGSKFDGICLKGHCVQCGYLMETSLHALRDCEFSKAMWKAVIPNLARNNFFSTNLKLWLNEYLSLQEVLKVTEGNWSTEFAILCWLLWKCRNIFIFNNSHNIVDVVVDTSLNWTKSFVNLKSCELHRIQMASGDHWGKAEKGWIKLITNGAFLKSTNIAVIGGVFRDHDGIGKCGFTMRIGKDSVFKTEVRAILESLNLASTFGFRQLELECDNALVVETILVDGVGANMLFELRLINNFYVVIGKFVFDTSLVNIIK
ncbi:hypothetical protein Gotur_005723 [Gossypium turneri]